MKDVKVQLCQTLYITIREMLFLLLHSYMTQLLVGFTTTLYIIGLFAPLDALTSKPIDTLGRQWWVLITANFVHYALWHVSANMLGLVIFGPPVERVLGAIRFLSFYLFSGILALFVVSIRGHGAAGASGSLTGVMGTLVFFSWIWRKKSEAGRGLFFLAITGSTVFMSSGIIFEAFFGINVADAAHITGFVFGLLVALMLWYKKLIPISPFNNIQ